MFDPLTLLAVAGTFLLAGTVKGVIGLGLPTVSLGLLTAALDLTTAMALLHFDTEACDAIVLEVGLGGRLDSTNVCAPSLSVVTSTGYATAAAQTSIANHAVCRTPVIIRHLRWTWRHRHVHVGTDLRASGRRSRAFCR